VLSLLSANLTLRFRLRASIADLFWLAEIFANVADLIEEFSITNVGDLRALITARPILRSSDRDAKPRAHFVPCEQMIVR